MIVSCASSPTPCRACGSAVASLRPTRRFGATRSQPECLSGFSVPWRSSPACDAHGAHEVSVAAPWLAHGSLLPLCKRRSHAHAESAKKRDPARGRIREPGRSWCLAWSALSLPGPASRRHGHVQRRDQKRCCEFPENSAIHELKAMQNRPFCQRARQIATLENRRRRHRRCASLGVGFRRTPTRDPIRRRRRAP